MPALKLNPGLIFDFNGTLLADGSLHEQAWNTIIQQRMPGRYSLEEIARVVRGRSNRDIVTALLGHDPSSEILQEWAGSKEALYRQTCLQQPGFSLAHGVTDFLDAQLAIGRPLALATLAPASNVIFFREQLGLDKWFKPACILFDDDSFPGKPAPDIFFKAAAALNLAPAECTVFGDSPADMTAATLAGISQIIHVDLTGKLPILPGAHHRISDFRELLK